LLHFDSLKASNFLCKCLFPLPRLTGCKYTQKSVLAYLLMCRQEQGCTGHWSCAAEGLDYGEGDKLKAITSEYPQGPTTLSCTLGTAGPEFTLFRHHSFIQLTLSPQEGEKVSGGLPSLCNGVTAALRIQGPGSMINSHDTSHSCLLSW
jgi:hypothetical protein